MQRILLTLISIFGLSPIWAQNPNPEEILQTMIAKAKEVNTIRYQAVMSERINDEMVVKNSFFKINNSPRNIYVAQSFIGIKLDGLYCQGWNNNQLLIATVGFPWIQVNLDPLGSRVRDKHHHTIFEAGFNYFVDVVDQMLIKHRSEIDITSSGKLTAYNRICYKINMQVKAYKIVKYTVQQGETLPTIAKNQLINDYKILELNPEIDDFWDIKPGQVINIPSVYGKSVSLYIDVENMLPVQIDIYDEKGLYGSYGYKNLIINVPFEHDEFSAKYKGYHFR